MPPATFEAIHEAVASVFGFGQEPVCSITKQYPLARARTAFVLLCAVAGKTEDEVRDWLERTKSGIEYAFRAAKNRYATEPAFRKDIAAAVEKLKHRTT